MNISPLNKWIPGALANGQIKQLCKTGWIEDLIADEQIGYSALDLTLTGEGYRMLRGCVKPFGDSYDSVLKNKKFASPLGKRSEYVLKPKNSYVFKIKQRLGHQFLNSGAIYAQATAKSSVGRMDVLARLIVDGMHSYEEYRPDPGKDGNGQMYLEITPITFTVKVKDGIALSQLRFFYGKSEDCELRGQELYGSILLGGGFTDGSLSVDLNDAEVVGEKFGAAFCAQPGQQRAICLWKDKTLPDPRKFWKLSRAEDLLVESETRKCLEIKKDAFYVLRSKEKISLPAGVCVYCRAIDETIGEMRIHYAGFVHPLFGRERPDGKRGTPLIFEVRGHDVQVTLTDNEKMARLTFYRMSENAKAADDRKSGYEDQTLKLSGFFAPWK